MSIATSKIYTPTYRKLIQQFPLRQIRTKKDADAATAILDKHFRDHYNDEGEEQYIFVLSTLLAEYEDKHDPVPDTATGLDVLRHLVEENGIRQAELSQVLGVGQSAVSMILSGDRPLTAEHARRLGKRFKIDAGVFL
jgi:HTH-type transcriptional regulator / antitoxin HigA